MQALQKLQHGAGHVSLHEVPIPTLGDDDVLLKVEAAGLCASDLDFIAGRQAEALHPPVILGHEFAGTVAKVGKNVLKWKVGDRVVSDNTGTVCGECYACTTGDYLACPNRLGLGYGMDGGFAPYCKILGDTLQKFPNSLMRIPDEISMEGAAILDPACNAYRAVVQEAHILPGEDIAIFGAGALGQFSVQCARAAGAAKIILIGLSEDHDRFLMAKEHGATHFIVSGEQNPTETVLDLTEGRGVGAVIDCAGANAVLKEAVRMVRAGGSVVKVGYDVRPLGFSLDVLLERAVRVVGHFGYDWVCWNNVMNLVLAGKFSLESVITHRMPLEDYKKAVELLQTKQAVKIILYP